MKLVCLLATLAVAFAADSYGGYTIEDIRNLADALEYTVNDLYADISETRTLNAVAQKEIQNIQDFFLPNLNLVNTQQSALGDEYTAQVKALQHRVDDALAQETEAFAIATATARDLGFQIDDYLNGTELADVSDLQDDIIANLTEAIDAAKVAFLGDLADTIGNLNNDLDDVNDKVDVLADFVSNRVCQYGEGAFSPNTDTLVNFTVPFASAPVVSISVTGFETDLDVHSYDQYDGISLDKYVSSVTATGFTVSTQDISEGMVELTRVYCSYMACVGLDDEVDIHPAGGDGGDGGDGGGDGGAGGVGRGTA